MIYLYILTTINTLILLGFGGLVGLSIRNNLKRKKEKKNYGKKLYDFKRV